MAKLRMLGAVLLSLAIVAGCSGGVAQEEYERVQATATASEQERAALSQKVERAGNLVAVIDSIFEDIIIPQSRGGSSQGGASQELIDTLSRQVAAQGNPALQAKLKMLLEAGDRAPSQEQFQEFNQMIQATGNPELMATWERIMRSGTSGPQDDPLRKLEVVVQASGDAALEGKFVQFRRANEGRGGISATRLAEIVELIRRSGKPDLVKQLDDALAVPFGGNPLTLSGIVRFGTAVQSVGDPVLAEMADKVFNGQGGETAFEELITYVVDRLAEGLR